MNAWIVAVALFAAPAEPGIAPTPAATAGPTKPPTATASPPAATAQPPSTNAEPARPATPLAVALGIDQGVYALTGDAFLQEARRDLALLQRFALGMRDVVSRLQRSPALFTPPAAGAIYAPEQRRTLVTAWSALYAYFSATEGLRQKYWGFVRLPRGDARHRWGFVLTHTALTSVLAEGLAFASLVAGQAQLETLLDERHDELGIPEQAFAQFKLTAVHVATAAQLATGDAWASTFRARERAGEPSQLVGWAWTHMSAASTRASKLLRERGVAIFAQAGVDALKDRGFRAVFPVQRGVAAWLGDTRVARVGRPLITRAQIDALVLPRLEPGDILTARQNWFLSNVGLPGFWPHAQLYVGTPGELASKLDGDPDVQAWAAAQPERAPHLSGLLQRRHPAKWRAYAEGADLEGHRPIRVIEAISEGVSFTSAEHAFGVDYLAAMRPRVTPLDKARAIERAFAYQGRPYDFDFDFFSDATLVCTELVFKAYQPGVDMKGLRLEVVDVAGRRTLPANELVKAFDRELDRPTRQLDFVFFIDAKERERRAFDSDAAALRASWRRFQWDVALP